MKFFEATNIKNAVLDNIQDDKDDQYDFHPKTFDQYLGQKELKKKLEVFTKAALMRNEPLDHMLLFGPPGLGKTTIAQIMAHVMNVSIKICNGPMIERTGDIVALLSSLQPKEILFIDEIHRMSTVVEEVLYNAMEHFKVDIIVGQGAGAKSVNLPIAPFTLIGATTKTGMISAPLRTRFGIMERLDHYDNNELQEIVMQNASFLKLNITPDAALSIGRAARGTPRIAKKLLKRVRDYVQVHNLGILDSNTITKALSFLSIDKDGLTSVDYLIIKALLERFDGGPAGIETLAAIVGEDKDTLEDAYEPFLIRCGYLEKTPRGRQIPGKQILHFKKIFLNQ